MPNEALRSIEGKSWVLEVTIPYIFLHREFFNDSIETFQDRPTMIFEVKQKKAQILQLIDILYIMCITNDYK